MAGNGSNQPLATSSFINPAIGTGGDAMKKEDLWLIIVLIFAVVWTAAFGWGIFG